MTGTTITRIALIVLLALSFTRSAAPANAMVATDDPVSGPAGAEPALPEAPAAFPQVAAPDPVVRWMIDQVSQETIRQYTGDLSGEWPVTVLGKTVTLTTRNTNSGTPIQYATNYVGDHLAARGLTVEYHQWSNPTSPNVIGQKTGLTSPGEIYLIGAHLDNVPSSGTAPGADDNASGSVGVMVAADILARFDWNCTLRFAFWTGEEQGLLGSDQYAWRAKDDGETIRGVLNLDMIAWNTAASPRDIDLHAKASMPATVDLANQAASVIEAYDIDLVPEVRSDGTGSSDHASFWKYGFNAILGIEDYYPSNHDFNPYYHTTSDQLEVLDMSYYTDFVKAMVAEMAHMSGCLVTGALQGHVTGAHDGSAIGGAEITLTDAAARSYKLKANASGGYSQPVPPATYSAVVTAYGYADGSAFGLPVAANGSATADFALTSLPPAAPAASAGLEAGEIRLNWPHIGPNMAYVVLRSADPYFEPGSGEVIATIPAAHPPAPSETLRWRDGESGAGNPGLNHYYMVVGENAAGEGAQSTRSGEFDFGLVKP